MQNDIVYENSIMETNKISTQDQVVMDTKPLNVFNYWEDNNLCF